MTLAIIAPRRPHGLAGHFFKTWHRRGHPVGDRTGNRCIACYLHGLEARQGHLHLLVDHLLPNEVAGSRVDLYEFVDHASASSSSPGDSLGVEEEETHD